MAIKVSGNTVISDGRNVVAGTFDATNISANGASLSGIAPSIRVLQPENLSPVDGASIEGFFPSLEISDFVGLFDNTHANTQFQVSIDSGFSNTEVDIFTNANTTVTVPSSLAANTEHFFRARFIDNDGCCSPFSKVTCFRTVGIPSTLGESIAGGFYIGTICAASTCYYLIMAPNATGCALCQWKTSLTDSSVGNSGEFRCDGYGNTYDHLADPTHPAANFTATRTIGGFSEWYLPSIDELVQLYTNKACVPAGEGFVSAFYWSSTECCVSEAKLRSMNTNTESKLVKNGCCHVRAIRRVAFP